MKFLDSINPNKGRADVERARKGLRTAVDRLVKALDEDVHHAVSKVATKPNGKHREHGDG